MIKVVTELVDEKLVPTEKYTIENIENEVLLVKFPFNQTVSDSFPCYPVCVYTNNRGEMCKIELLHSKDHWNNDIIILPKVAKSAKIKIDSIGELKNTKNFKVYDTDADVYYDPKKEIVKIYIGVHPVIRYVKIARDVLVGMDSENKLVEVLLVGFGLSN